MKARSDPDRVLTDWLHEEAPGRAPDHLRDELRLRLDRTSQVRPPILVRWYLPLFRPAFAAAAVMLAIVLGGGFWIATNPSRIGAEPTPTPTARPTLGQVSVSCAPTPRPTACSDHTYAFDPQISFTLGAYWTVLRDRTSVAGFTPPGAGHVGGRPTTREGAIVIAPDNFFNNGIVWDNIAVYRDPIGISADGTRRVATGGTTASALSRWLSARPELVATAPAPATVGGLNGYRGDIRLSRAAPTLCGGLCADFFGHGESSGTWTFGIAGAEWARVFLLDEPNGPPLLVVIDGVTMDQAQLIPICQPVLDSLRFSTAP